MCEDYNLEPKYAFVKIKCGYCKATIEVMRETKKEAKKRSCEIMEHQKGRNQMKTGKSADLRIARLPQEWRRAILDNLYISLFAAVWGLISLSPWWYPSDMTPLQILGVGVVIFTVAFILTPIVQWAFRRLKRPLKQRKVRITYDSRGGRCDRERLGYISAKTICDISKNRGG